MDNGFANPDRVDHQQPLPPVALLVAAMDQSPLAVLHTVPRLEAAPEIVRGQQNV